MGRPLSLPTCRRKQYTCPYPYQNLAHYGTTRSYLSSDDAKIHITGDMFSREIPILFMLYNMLPGRNT